MAEFYSATTASCGVSVVQYCSAFYSSLDLTDNADLALIKDQAKTDMATIAGVNTTAFNALADDTATAVENVNAKIEDITDTNLDSDASKNIFSTTQVLADQVKAAVAAEANSADYILAEPQNCPKK